MYLDDVILGNVVLVTTNLNLEHDKAGVREWPPEKKHISWLWNA